MNSAIPTAAQIAEQRSMNSANPTAIDIAEQHKKNAERQAKNKQEQLTILYSIIGVFIGGCIIVALCYVGYMYWKSRPKKPTTGLGKPNSTLTCADRFAIIERNLFGVDKTAEKYKFLKDCPNFEFPSK